MKKIIFTLIILYIATSFSQAEEPVSSDFVVLTDVLSQGIKKIMTSYSPFSGKTVTVSYSHGIELSSKTRETVDALLTTEGFSITQENHNPDYRFTIVITDASIILQRSKGQINRSVWMKIHMKCMDASQNVIFASGRGESFCDIIPRNLVELTDDSTQFSKDIRRKLIKRNYDRLRHASFIVITGILVFFAFQ